MLSLRSLKASLSTYSVSGQGQDVLVHSCCLLCTHHWSILFAHEFYASVKYSTLLLWLVHSTFLTVTIYVILISILFTLLVTLTFSLYKVLKRYLLKPNIDQYGHKPIIMSNTEIFVLLCFVFVCCFPQTFKNANVRLGV